MLLERPIARIERKARQFFGNVKRLYVRRRVAVWISSLTVLFLIFYLAPLILIFVHSGEAGVLYRRFGGGTETEVIYTEGAHVIWPWDEMTIYEVRINEMTSRFSVISTNGLDIAVTASIRFYPKLRSLGLLHQQAGPDYAEKIVIPEIQAIVRRLFADYKPEDIYRTQSSLAEAMRAEASERLAQRFIVLDALLIKSIELPAIVQGAIQSKVVAEHAAEEMKFKIEREAGEKRRKLIEADGIKLFNQSIQESLSDEVLKYKSIEVLAEIAKSANSNTLIFGAPDGLPYLFNLGQGTAPRNLRSWGNSESSLPETQGSPPLPQGSPRALTSPGP
jgi:regulator of protease activity HflC (stomatin/prohibitin superfamily)